MATAALNKSGSWYGRNSSSSWTDSSVIYSGKSDDVYYRSKIALSTDGLDISKSQVLEIDIELTSNSSPKGCMGVLSTNGNLKPSQVQNSSNSAPSNALLGDGFIASCYASPQKTDMPSGDHFYFTFETDKLEAGQTYYLYLIRSLHASGYTGSGFCKSSLSKVIATLTYEDFYCVRIGNDRHAVYLHDGAGFNKYRPYIRKGTEWQPYDK